MFNTFEQLITTINSYIYMNILLVLCIGVYFGIIWGLQELEAQKLQKIKLLAQKKQKQKEIIRKCK